MPRLSVLIVYTARYAILELTVSFPFHNTACTESPLLPVILKVSVVIPVKIPFLYHATLTSVPVYPTENVPCCPEITVSFCGCDVIVGAKTNVTEYAILPESI
jgi:hypothetical protein